MNKLKPMAMLAVGAVLLAAAVWAGGAASADDRFRFASCSVEFILQDGRFVAVDGRSWLEVDPAGECRETAEDDEGAESEGDDPPADDGGAEGDGSRSAPAGSTPDEADQQDDSEDSASSDDGSFEPPLPPGVADYLAHQAQEQQGGASDAPRPCTTAVKPETGPALISFVDNAACVIVRGGGAVQVSRGDYTLNVTLPAGRDWDTYSHSDAFAFFDLTTGGWIYLNAADGAELRRHDSTGVTAWYPPNPAPVIEYIPLKEGFPALLDAIAASAAVPAAAESPE